MALIQAQVVFNDNAFKLITIGLIGIVMTTGESTFYKVMVAVLTILPFVLLAPLSGWISDRFPKFRVIQMVMLGQVLVTAIMLFGIHHREISFCIVAFAGLSALCAIISPAKIGIIKEYVGHDRLGFYAGFVEMLTVLAILGGAFLGGTCFDWFTRFFENEPWVGAFWCAVSFGVLSGSSFVSSLFLSRSESHVAPAFRWKLLVEHFGQIQELWNDLEVRICALGIAYFYAVGGVVFLVLVDVGLMLHPGGVGAAGATGVMMALMGTGIAAGSLTAGILSRKSIELGAIPLGAGIMALSYASLFFLPAEALLFYILLFLGGFGGGLYIVPLNARLQDIVPPARRGGIFAGMNLLTNLFAVAALLGYYLLIEHFKLTPSDQFFVLMMTGTGVAILAFRQLMADFFRLLARGTGGLLYRVVAQGAGQIPKSGGVLLLSNHVSYVDTVLLQMACHRPIRFIMIDEFYEVSQAKWFFQTMKAIPLYPKRVRRALEEALRSLREGDIVCLFPEGRITRDGQLAPLSRGMEFLAARANCAVICAHLGGDLWGSRFSHHPGTGKWGWTGTIPVLKRRFVSVRFSGQIAPQDVSAENIRRIMGMSER